MNEVMQFLNDDLCRLFRTRAGALVRPQRKTERGALSSTHTISALQSAGGGDAGDAATNKLAAFFTKAGR